MTTIKTLFGLLVAVVAAVVGVVAFVAAQASASSAPIVITYEKRCDADNHCLGEAGDGGSIDMQATFLASRKPAPLMVTEEITVGDISFTAVLYGHFTPVGFIVLNGTVTDGSYEGAQVHQRSNFERIEGDKSVWAGELQLMPASA
jgi:hypothetical protein